jgi:hypothetical protein
MFRISGDTYLSVHGQPRSQTPVAAHNGDQG